ncbi:uncharacterized protein A4U43_C03F3110 [Asparagus officinalis]|uniref:ABC transporter domain-containing protein n=1 Tax=Asparagus officinalis TaxID=4686 RepID=A0A5P1F8Q7_ASPOF|nr:uncharacterized protein A4U43_C03F3110 [Asparagus officinalis]
MTMSDIKVAFQNLSYKYPLSPATRSKNFKSIGNSMALMERSGDRSVDCSVHIESAEEEGVCVTWEDLSVTAFDGNRSSRKILSGLTGFARPGQVLAIMGPSGCGKSTLLDALAGRLGSNAKQSGNILVNGRKQTLSFGTSAYVTQNDILMTTLTVKEAVYYSAELQLPNSMSKSEKRQRAEVTIKEMGLQDAVNTSIGGVHSKGISGGQRRRVSICIEILTRPKLLFLDEPTSGLDSAASFHVMNRIANLAKFDDMNTIASIHQPSSEVFELFDNLCLLSSGITVYFGPRTMANEEGDLVKKGNQASFISQCTVLTKRSFVNMYRDLGYYWLRLAIYAALCLSIGTMFHNIGHDYGSIQARGSALMFVAGFLTFMGISGFPSFVEEMKIFHQERLNGHYGVTAFVISSTLSSAPYLFLVSVVPASLAYYLIGLQPERVAHLSRATSRDLSCKYPAILYSYVKLTLLTLSLQLGIFESIENLMAMEMSSNRSMDRMVHIVSPEDYMVNLTWEDLWVTVSDSNGTPTHSCQSGLGHYGSHCEKSTLLDALAGLCDSKSDTLMSTLTLKEAVYYSAQLQLPDSMSKVKKRERAEATIKEMGLQDAMNTRIGEQNSEGISGGQRRRVGICIEILTHSKFLLVDEPTSSLDSAASFHVMKRIVNLAKFEAMNIVVSIHQPSCEVFCSITCAPVYL